MRRSLIVLFLWLTFPVFADEVTVVFREPEDPRYLPVRTHLGKDPYLMQIPRALDQLILFPRPLTIQFAQIGKANAFYSPRDHSITVGYELYPILYNLFHKNGYSHEESLRQANFALAHIFLHEWGHALIGELDLPVTGREEDCADEFATLVCASFIGEKGRDIAMASAQFFKLLGSNVQHIDQLHFWDEHSLHRQRHYKILCDLHAGLKGGLPGIESMVPVARIKRAVEEYPRKERSWLRQLAPHFEGELANKLVRLKPAVDPPGKISGALGVATGEKSSELLKALRDSKGHLILAEGLDKLFLWPRDFTLLFSETGDGACHYDKENARIVISLDFLGEVAKFLEGTDLDKRDQQGILGGVILFTVTQQACSALIHELDLPWTGELEDVTSEFATITMVRDQTGREHALALTRFHTLMAKKDQKLSELRFWQVGPLRRQRVHDILGYCYSQDRKTFKLVEKIIPERRLKRYQIDFKKKTDRWRTLLTPYRK